ncbi:MAG: cardiolipin synthase [Gammaproteobacteria bacterium]|jgi:cardiolipin synthase|nr:cardiolipin synthase [Gammaproteobacteria bacterium]
MDQTGWLALGALILHWSLVIGLSARIIMRRRPVGILLAWIALILSLPFLGVVVYLFVGENRVSSRFLKRSAAVEDTYAEWRETLHRHGNAISPDPRATATALVRQAETIPGFPAQGGNRVVLLDDYETIFRAIIGDISRAQRTCHLEFYIWHPGGLSDELLDTLIGACKRGVVCRVLLDGLGSKPFLSGRGAARLRESGVQVTQALPVGLLSMFEARADLRNHRKIVVIDGEIAYTGSQNLVDPRFFKQDVGVGRWIDAMVRIEGPAVEPLGGTFIHDWEINTGAGLETLEDSHDVHPVEPRGDVTIQVAPSGPFPQPVAIMKMILTTIYSARREIILTTPYFVPDDAVLIALISAANRGVEVTIVIPDKNDSRLAHLASQSVFDELLEAGVRIARFRGGLLHTKSVCVDGEFCVFGSVNLDMRSLWLNFEISLIILDTGMTSRIHEMQRTYVRDSEIVDPAEWVRLPLHRKFIINAAHLVAPLL